jgi:hypothetical protein
MIIPPALFSSASTRRISTRSCKGRKSIFNLSGTFLKTGVGTLVTRVLARLIASLMLVKQVADFGTVSRVWTVVMPQFLSTPKCQRGYLTPLGFSASLRMRFTQN